MTMTALWYHLRLQLNGVFLTVLCLPVVVTVFTNSRSAPLQFAELFWPLGAPLLTAALFSREWEGGTAEVLLCRPTGRAQLLAGRTLAATLLIGAMLMAGWVTQLLLGQPVALPDLVRSVMPGALALGAVGLLVATAARNSAAGYLVPTAWWLIDWLTGGSYTGRFYLMSTNKGWLLGLAGGGLLATLACLHRRDR